jgi:hypothetical protein
MGDFTSGCTHIYREIGNPMERSLFISGQTQDLMKSQFAVTRYATEQGGMGHVGKLCHKQPFLEAKLREACQETTVQLRCNSTVCAISEDKEHVYVT